MKKDYIDAMNEFCLENNYEISIVTNDGCPSFFIMIK